ncbi:MAG: HAD family hydrolase, partial [Lachnospiraceae bacterium]|nr:HAD family hydrolase [Lachnospiraceae bacterium]
MKVVLFDLDGTLLPMDQEKFIEAYMGTMAKKLALHGYEPKVLGNGVFAGIKSMVANDGSMTNEEAFWKAFSGIVGEQVKEDLPIFEDYYRNEFQSVSEVCGYDARANEIIDYI